MLAYVLGTSTMIPMLSASWSAHPVSPLSGQYLASEQQNAAKVMGCHYQVLITKRLSLPAYWLTWVPYLPPSFCFHLFLSLSKITRTGKPSADVFSCTM